MKKAVLLLSFVLMFNIGKAQQDPEFTNYMYNHSLINPAYATGTPSILNLGTFYRTQWVGAVGSPETFSFFGHLPINKKIETGISFFSDEIGEGALKESAIYADFAYILKLTEKYKLSFGLKAGLSFLNTDFSDFRLESGPPSSDPAFGQNIDKTFPKIGIGAFFYSENYYVGLSTPSFLKGKHLDETEGIQHTGSEEIHLYLTGGYVFDLNEDFKLKPSFLVRSVKGIPPMFDVSMNVRYLDRFELGVSYRVDDSFSGLFNIGVTPSLRIGYAYDHTITNLGRFESGSHEIFLLYDLNFFRGHDKSPRFF